MHNSKVSALHDSKVSAPHDSKVLALRTTIRCQLYNSKVLAPLVCR